MGESVAYVSHILFCIFVYQWKSFAVLYSSLKCCCIHMVTHVKHSPIVTPFTKITTFCSQNIPCLRYVCILELKDCRVAWFNTDNKTSNKNSIKYHTIHYVQGVCKLSITEAADNNQDKGLSWKFCFNEDFDLGQQFSRKSFCYSVSEQALLVGSSFTEAKPSHLVNSSSLNRCSLPSNRSVLNKIARSHMKVQLRTHSEIGIFRVKVGQGLGKRNL